jgi:hypothetical protein
MSISAAAAPRPAQAMEVGLQDDNVFLYKYYYDREKAFDQAKAFGVSYLRVNFIWADYARSRFRMYDDLVNAARRHGIRIEFTMLGTQSFYGGSRYISYRNPSPTRYAAWLRTVARHFNGKVTRYAIWNEPQLPRYLQPHGRAVQLYRALYKAGYAAIKGVNRRNQVLIGELTSSQHPLEFLAGTVRGQRFRTDGLAYHPFQFYVEPGKPDRRYVGISNIPKIKALLRKLARRGELRYVRGSGAPPIYGTEFGYLTRGIYQMPEAKRADWTPKAFRVARRNGLRQLLYYMFLHPPSSFVRGEIWDSGILNTDGTPTPTYNALVDAFQAGGF